jgi:hypothetical protein
VNDSQVVRLSGNTRPEANAKNDRGALPDGYNVDHILLVLQRSPQREKAVEAYIDSLNDRNSPNFHRWLTAEEFGERFGVSQQDIDTVTGWLESHGFTINTVYASHMMIDFSGNAGQVAQAFHTSMHNLAVEGESHIANMSDPWIPAALAPVIKGIFSLNDFKPHKNLKAKPDYTFAGCASSTDAPTEPGTCYAMTPGDNWTVYNLNPLFSAGYSGQGQTIALVEDTDSYGTDFQSYRNAFGLNTLYPAGNLVTAQPGGCTDPGTNADDSEADLDVEIASAIAPSATIELISCEDGTVTFGGLTALQNLINGSGPYPGVVSVSYGVCEVLNGTAGNAAFFDTYEQAASEGISVFGASGDEGPSSCSANFGTSTTEDPYQVTSLGVSGWTDTPYNVAVGGTDFEDTYNSKTGQNGGAPLSTYWSSTNGTYYNSALKYVPEIPWNDSCASTLIAEVANGSFTTYGTSGTCGKSPFDTTSSYLTQAAGSGGASNCATGNASSSANATDQFDYLMTTPDCQGYAKPSWQSAYGVPNDGVRDIPDLSMFAANGVWGHYEVVCWSDTSNGGASCAGAPSTWSGFGGTSVASPTAAAIQALVNQKTGTAWGNPNPIYYQIAQGEYGTQGGTFAGSSCNSSGTGGPASSCVFNDVTQGDIDLPCEENGTTEEAHCYDEIATVSHGRTTVTAYGVDSTDDVTGSTIVNGGTGYTSAPTCTIAGPTNSNPYKSPTGTTLWAGGTQATCTASINTGTTTAVWSATILSADAADGMSVVVGSQSFTLTGTTTATIATNLASAINSGSTVATATASSATVTITSKTAGYAGNLNVSLSGNVIEGVEYAYIVNTTLGQGPGYVSAIAITAAGSGYQPDTPITFGGGGGSGAIALANTTPGTVSSSYQPAYGAAPGYDMATGLGSVNAYNLANNCVWTSTCVQPQTITVTTAPPASAVYNSTFNVAATASSGLAVAITSSGSCSGAGSGSATITITSGTGTCSTIFNQAGNSSYSAAPTITDTTSATPASQTISLLNVPASAAYGQSFTVTATGGGSGNGVVLTSDGVVCSNSGATYTIIASSGNCSVIANQAGNSNYSAAPQVTDLVAATTATSSTSVGSSLNPSTYGQSVTFTATISGEYGSVKKNVKGRVKAQGVKSQAVTGSVTWNDSNGPITCTESGNSTTTVSNGTATCTLSTLPVSSDTITGAYSGDSNHTGSSGSTIQTINAAGAEVSVSGTPDPSTYGQTVVFTATINGQYGLIKGRKKQIATGSVAWSDANGSMSCAEGNPSTVTSGAATCTVSNLAVGPADTITAAYSGDSNHNPGTGTTSQEIDLATTTTGVTSSPNPSIYAQQVVFTATITAENGAVKGRVTKNGVKRQVVGGSVTWSTNTGCGTTTVTNGVATCTTSAATSLPVGSDTVTATYLGDSNHSGSTGSVIQVVQGGIATTINVTGVSPSSEDYGADSLVTITAVLSWTGHGVAPTASDVTISGNGNGTYSATTCNPRVQETITCTATYTPTTGDVAGSYTETAAFSGDTNYSPSSSPQTNNFTINLASSSVSVGSNNNPSTYGQTVVFTATITAENGAVKRRNLKVKSQEVTGTVAWSDANGSLTCAGGNPTTVTAGTTTCTVSNLAGNPSDTITAAYSGDSNHSASSGTLSQVINPAAQTVTFTTNAPASAVYGGSFTVAATGGASGNPVTFASAGGCSNVGATYTMTSGTTACSVTANQAGNNNYAAGSKTETTTAKLATQTVSFTTKAPASAVYDTSFTVAATATSGLAVVYTASGACSNVGATYTMTSGSGSCIVQANQPGNTNYSAAAQVTETVAAAPVSQTITVTTPAPATAVDGSSFTVAATASSGMPVSYSSSGGCTNVGATFTMESSGSTACTVKYNQGGDNNYKAATQITETTTPVTGTQPTVSFTGAPATAPYLGTFPVTASTNAGVNATLTTKGSCTVSGTSGSSTNETATVTITSDTGTCTMTASWPATSVYAATTLTQSTTEEKATPTVTWANPAPITYGTALSETQLDATASVAGTFKYTPAAGKVLAAGTQTLSVKFTPTSKDYSSVTQTATLVVNHASTTTTITSISPSNPTAGTKVVVYFTVSNGTTSYPTGKVTVSDNAGDTACSATLSNAVASCKITLKTAGPVTLTATYPGDANDTGSSGTYALTVQPE